MKAHSAYGLTEDGHRVTAFEIFFDLVFVFAFTRVISFMVHALTPVTLLQGLIMLVLLWWAWSAYTWLGNQMRADVGVAMLGGIAAMAAMFVVGLFLPDAWHDTPGGLDGPLTLAIAYTIVRVLYVGTYLYASAGDRQLRHQLLGSSIPTVIAWVPFIIGALVGGTAQIVLWATTFVIDFAGGAAISRYGGFRVRSPGYFAERHGLVVIIALGESIAAIGAGVGAIPITDAILAAALLGFALSVCLWSLYFRTVAPAAEHRLAELQGSARAWLARDLGTFLHFPLIAGIIYAAVGVEQVLVFVSRPGEHAAALGWLPVSVLYGGVAVYLAGRSAIYMRATGSAATTRLATVALPVALLPAARLLPALAALGLLTVVLAGLAIYEAATHAKRT